MRTIRKRLTCVNRGPSVEAHQKNMIAIQKIIDRYVAKMNKKGWKLGEIFTGDAMFQYEAIVYMTK